MSNIDLVERLRDILEYVINTRTLFHCHHPNCKEFAIKSRYMCEEMNYCGECSANYNYFRCYNPFHPECQYNSYCEKHESEHLINYRPFSYRCHTCDKK